MSFRYLKDKLLLLNLILKNYMKHIHTQVRACVSEQFSWAKATEIILAGEMQAGHTHSTCSSDRDRQREREEREREHIHMHGCSVMQQCEGMPACMCVNVLCVQSTIYGGGRGMSLSSGE